MWLSSIHSRDSLQDLRQETFKLLLTVSIKETGEMK